MSDRIARASGRVAYWESVALREGRDSPRAEFIARRLRQAHAYYDRVTEQEDEGSANGNGQGHDLIVWGP